MEQELMKKLLESNEQTQKMLKEMTGMMLKMGESIGIMQQDITLLKEQQSRMQQDIAKLDKKIDDNMEDISEILKLLIKRDDVIANYLNIELPVQ